ncbi:MAG: SAM-dependent DNA methyltransferase, partial [Bacteroidetes Order II. Incertae sedis bacterium]|nr:SAM-dependent DNA methyltransferase [Bacteroidetes Order II. bacterium]
GSLIDPKSLVDPNYFQDTEHADFSELKPLLDQALAHETDNVEDAERAVAAQGMAQAAELLSGEYTLVITNVPYLGRGQQSDPLKRLAEDQYKEAKADLATIFVDRMLRWSESSGSIAAVTPQNWLFLTRYTKLRVKLLKRRTWNLIARLGPGAFETISGEIVNVALSVITGSKPSENTAVAGVDVSNAATPSDKAARLCGKPDVGLGQEQADGRVSILTQREQLKNPDCRITFEVGSGLPLLAEYAISMRGIVMGDGQKWARAYWEVVCVGNRWRLLQSTVTSPEPYRGREHVIDWSTNGDGMLRPGTQNEAYGRLGVAMAQMGQLSATLFTGELYDNNTGVIVPKEHEHYLPIWCFCTSPEYVRAVREVDQALKVTNASLVKVPFDLPHWQKVAAEKYPNGLPEPQSDDPTQWLFHGHPAQAEPSTILQVAVARLLGYRWPPELDAEMRLADEARTWVARCDALNDFTDEDGIVCLSAIRGKRPAVERLRAILSAAFGTEWSASKERNLLALADDGKQLSASLEDWLRDKFFEEHCKLFHQRPFIWHIWDGNKDGFHCLVNAHKLTGSEGIARRTLESITYSYLGDWIERQKTHQQAGQEGADARLVAALDLKEQLQKILAGEPPYDIFVRWKPLAEQAIGWNPDINDGVRLNIRPFMKAELRKGGKKGAGLLRWKPNIHWKKDRGKEPQCLRPQADFPWFWTCDGEGHASARLDFSGSREFDGNRWNDLHYSTISKQAAQNMVEGENF